MIKYIQEDWRGKVGSEGTSDKRSLIGFTKRNLASIWNNEETSLGTGDGDAKGRMGLFFDLRYISRCTGMF